MALADSGSNARPANRVQISGNGLRDVFDRQPAAAGTMDNGRTGMTNAQGCLHANRASCLLIMAITLFLGGCAARPGPEVLRTIEARVPGAQTVTIYAATTRERAAENANVFTLSLIHI